MLASFRNLLRSDPGFDGSGVVTAAFSLPPQRYETDSEVRDFTDCLLAAIRAIPGVDTAGLTAIPDGRRRRRGPIIADDYEAEPGESVVSPWRVQITPGYLEHAHAALRGRGFDERDRADTEHVMLIDESLAKRFWATPIRSARACTVRPIRTT